MQFISLKSQSWLLFGILIVALFGCTREPVSGPLRFLLPWPDGAGSYSLQEVQINTLTDAREVRGAALDLYLDPSVKNHQLSGARASVDFIVTEDGKVIPKNFLSSQLLGLYAHVEKLWDLDKIAGADVLLPRPRKYGFGVRERSGQLTMNNAFYTPELDTIMILPFDGSNNENYQQLPMSLNAGIMGHEHFHSIFSALIKTSGSPLHSALQSESGTKEFTDITPRAQVEKSEAQNWNAFLIHSLDEGLADIWGWIYSGDARFIKHSLPAIEETRRLDYSPTGPIRTVSEFKSERLGTTGQVTSAVVYELGTYIARRVHADLVENHGDTAGSRQTLAKHIVQQLTELSKLMESKASATAEVEIETIVQMFVLPKVAQKEVQP